MKNILRKALALLLCLCMCLSLVPAVYAEGDGIVGVDPLIDPETDDIAGGRIVALDEPADNELAPDEAEPPDDPVGDGVLDVPQTPDADDEEILISGGIRDDETFAAVSASGSWGNLSWRLDDDGCLTISGYGPMEDFSDNSSAAWRSCRTSIVKVVIGNGVTSIGDNAFGGCDSLTSITIPNGVTSIGGSAFSYCTSLTSITIPDSVTSIGEGAFLWCIGLTSVHINSLAAWCGISFSYDTSNPLHYAHNLYIGGNLVQELIIPDGVTSIGSYAFDYCNSLTSITISNSVTSIRGRAFSYCTSLTSITIPDSVTSIGSYAFNYCTSLTSITIPDSVTSIGEGAFYNCTSLTSITIPNSVTSIRRGAFEGCNNLTSVTIPNSVTSIGDNAFGGCYSLTNITIPDSVTSIGVYAFYSSDLRDRDVYYAGTKDQWDAILKTQYSFPDGVTIHYNSTGPELRFDINRDAWNFINTDTVFCNPFFGNLFGGNYFIYDSDFQRLLDGSTNVEKEILRKKRDEWWSGSCHGMAVSAILVKMGILSASDFESGKTRLRDVSNPNDDKIESLINYYHFSQYLAIPWICYLANFYDLSVQERLENIEDLAKEANATGNPFLLSIRNPQKSHAVVGYGYEQGAYIKNNRTYNSRILIYDPDDGNGSGNSHLYYNKGTSEWYIPNHSDYNILQFATNELYALDPVEHRNMPGVSYYTVRTFDQEAVFVYFNGRKYQLFRDGGLGYITLSDSAGGSSPVYYLIPPGAPDYRFETPGGGELEFAAGDVMFNTSAENASEILVTDDGQMSFTTNGEYVVSTVFNENLCTTPWYKVELSGNTDGEIRMRQAQSGFMLEGDLNDVMFTAINDDNAVDMSVSTDADSVLVEETDDGLAAYVDTDGDGEYETKIGDGTEVSVTDDPVLGIPIEPGHFPDAKFRAYIRENFDRDDPKNGCLSAEEIAQVSSIDVRGAEIKSLAGIKTFTALNYLNCGDNLLTTLDLSGCTDLKELTCRDNLLTKLVVGGCSALEWLDCTGNGLTGLDLSGCGKVDCLQCSGNSLTILDIGKCPSLLYLFQNGARRETDGVVSHWYDDMYFIDHAPGLSYDAGVEIWTKAYPKPDCVTPADLSRIEEEAYAGCGFRCVELNEGLTYIGPRAFADCPNLTCIYIPAPTIRIDPEAFGTRTALTVFGPPNGDAEVFAQDHGLAFVAVPQAGMS